MFVLYTHEEEGVISHSLPNSPRVPSTFPTIYLEWPSLHVLYRVIFSTSLLSPHHQWIALDTSIDYMHTFFVSSSQLYMHTFLSRLVLENWGASSPISVAFCVVVNCLSAYLIYLYDTYWNDFIYFFHPSRYFTQIPICRIWGLTIFYWIFIFAMTKWRELEERW